MNERYILRIDSETKKKLFDIAQSNPDKYKSMINIMYKVHHDINRKCWVSVHRAVHFWNMTLRKYFVPLLTMKHSNVFDKDQPTLINTHEYHILNDMTSINVKEYYWMNIVVQKITSNRNKNRNTNNALVLNQNDEKNEEESKQHQLPNTLYVGTKIKQMNFSGFRCSSKSYGWNKWINECSGF